MKPIRTSADGPDREPPLCNVCGLTCLLGEPSSGESSLRSPNSGGLERVTVRGNYDSTPGNGHGALDDCTSYSFSICEWCLDWLFTPDIDGTPETAEEFRPTARRVADDDWRQAKDAFRAEFERRKEAREAPGGWPSELDKGEWKQEARREVFRSVAGGEAVYPARSWGRIRREEFERGEWVLETEPEQP